MNQGQGNMTASNYLVNIVELQNVVTSATGLNAVDQLTFDLNNIQQMVSFAEKRIFTNVISKFDRTPIQVTDDINLSNVNLYQNGIVFSGSGTSGGAGTINVSSGGTAIILRSTTSGVSTAISFNVGSRPVFTFDGLGRALYYDASGLGNRFWISSATLIADKFRLGSNGAPGKFLEAIDTSGNATWNYVSSLSSDGSDQASVNISSSGIFFRTGTQGPDAGRIDSNRNWYLGAPAVLGNADLQAGSNDFTVIGGPLRYQGAGTPVVGDFLYVTDSYGTLGLSSFGSGSGLSSFVVGDQIQSQNLTVRTDGNAQIVTVTSGYNEILRLTSSGFLGLSNSDPQATLDVGGSAIIQNELTINSGAQPDYVFKSVNSDGLGQWAEPTRIFQGTTLNELAIDSSTTRITGKLNGQPLFFFNVSAAKLGVSTSYNLDVSGRVFANSFASQNATSPIQFFFGSNGRQALYMDPLTGNLGLGSSTPSVKLTVEGSGYFNGNLGVNSNLTVNNNATINGNLLVTNVAAGTLSGSGPGITNIQTYNVGFGSNQLNTFQGVTRSNIYDLQVSQSTLSTTVFSTIASLNLNGGLAFFSTLSSYIIQASNNLSASIGPGAGAVVSSYSTCVGLAEAAQFSTLSSYIIRNTVQFSTLSSAILTTSLQDRAYASTIAFSTASTLTTVGISTTLSTGFAVTGNILLYKAAKLWLSSASAIGIGYKTGQDLSGAIDVSGLIYSRGLRGFTSSFGFGVGTSTTTQLIAGGYSPGCGWRLNVIGDVDISGQIFRNGALYSLTGRPDPYWTRNGSAVFYNDGAVGIGVTSPTYPLDVAGRIRCFGVDVVQGPGPSASTSQGQYISPWLYQQSNIYYPLGGVGIGTGVSSVGYGVFLDVSGQSRFRNAATFVSSLGVNIPYGSTLTATADIAGSLHAAALNIDTIGNFGGRVTARDFLSLSDQRYKTEIETLDKAIPILQSIRGVRFRWKDSEIRDVGLLAQEVRNMVPEAVSGDLESGFTVAYDKLVPVLIEAVKSLHARVVSLERHFKETV
jgi:hypothetical protein